MDKDLFKKYDKPREQNVKEEEWWQIAGKEMTKFYNKKCYFLFWKYSRDSIDRAFQIAKKDNDREFTHLMKNLTK